MKFEYHLLDKLTSKGGIIFWMSDDSMAFNNEFINRILLENGENLPIEFVIAMATSKGGDPLTVQVFSSENGGVEVHIDHNNSGVKNTRS